VPGDTGAVVYRPVEYRSHAEGAEGPATEDPLRERGQAKINSRDIKPPRNVELASRRSREPNGLVA
jgi:hypothetical protein